MVSDSIDCGLASATIKVVEEEGEKSEYSTDEGGWFEFALVRGKTYVITATYKDHAICFAGTSIDDAVEYTVSCEGMDTFVELTRVDTDSFIFFTDATRRTVDLGLYKGVCDSQYDSATFKIVPINGCHKAIFQTSEQIRDSWMDSFDSLGDKIWPFAAMDYSVTLAAGPDVGGVGDIIANSGYADGCATEPGSVVDFFRKRNTLERLIFARDSAINRIRYRYHGYICIFIGIEKIEDEHDRCFDDDDDETEGKIHIGHFLGESTYFGEVFGEKISSKSEVKVRVFELHIGFNSTGAKVADECLVLPSPDRTIGDEPTGHTLLSFRQDVTDEDENPCHPNKGGDAECDFEITRQRQDGDGFIVFPGEPGELEKSSKTVEAGKPNLAGNNRRNVEVKVVRNDNFFSVPAFARRNLIPLGSKARGGEGGTMDNVFWATVPLEGLVYTVVHDPPGGDSYAELAIGSTVGMEFHLTGTRAASMSDSSSSELGVPEQDLTPLIGFAAGWVAEGQAELQIDLLKVGAKTEAETTGPTVKMSSTNTSGWSLETTTSRVIRSSQDEAMPGRDGDVILGGGIELVYKLSDKLDIVDDARTLNKPCLYIATLIEWLPRRPTTYSYTIGAIESMVIPNLKFLYSVVLEGGVANDGSGMLLEPSCANENSCTQEETITAWTQYIKTKLDSWSNTIEWASPSIYIVNGAKNYEAIANISSPLTDQNSLVGKRFDDQIKRFESEFERPMKTTMDELKDTWEQTFLMSPNTGFRAMFGNGQDSDGEWLLDEDWWESEDDDIDAITAESEDNPSGSGGGTSEFDGWGEYDPEEDDGGPPPAEDNDGGPPPVEDNDGGPPPVEDNGSVPVPDPVSVEIERDTVRCAGVHCDTASQQSEQGTQERVAKATIEQRQTNIASKSELIAADRAAFNDLWEKQSAEYKRRHNRDPPEFKRRIAENKYLNRQEKRRLKQFKTDYDRAQKANSAANRATPETISTQTGGVSGTTDSSTTSTGSDTTTDHRFVYDFHWVRHHDRHRFVYDSKLKPQH